MRRCGHPHQGNSANRHTRAAGADWPHAFFIAGESFGERFAGAGLTLWALHCLVIYIAFFLKPVQVSFHLSDGIGEQQRGGTVQTVHVSRFPDSVIAMFHRFTSSGLA